MYQICLFFQDLGFQKLPFFGTTSPIPSRSGKNSNPCIAHENALVLMHLPHPVMQLFCLRVFFSIKFELSMLNSSAVRALNYRQTDTHTHTQMGAILFPRLLTPEVIATYKPRTQDTMPAINTCNTESGWQFLFCLQ